MDIETNKAVNEVIVELCEYIKKAMKSDSAIDHEQLPSLVASLAKLKG